MPGDGADSGHRPRDVTAALTARARGVLVLVVAAVAATAVTGASDAVVLAAPAAAALAVGLVAGRTPRIAVAARAEPLRVPEGGTVTAMLTLESDRALTVTCTPAVGARAEAERVTVALQPATPVTVRSRVHT